MCPLFLSDLNENSIFFFCRFSEDTQISNFVKTLPVGAELFHADGQIGMTKLAISFHNFAKAPTNYQPFVLYLERD